MIKRKNQPSGW
ncbi:hypothetical protein YPPY72_4029, partial [Yersinia pestis PY-72]